jgi:mRNA interferase MazF
VILERGTVVLLSLDPSQGHEQRGTRPCVLVSDPEVVADQRFPLLAVVPVTGTPATGALYPRLESGRSGLTRESYALVDHLRSVDKRRVRRLYGAVSAEELRAIDDGLLLFLGLQDGASREQESGGPEDDGIDQ